MSNSDVRIPAPATAIPLAASFAACEAITAAAKSSFPIAFRLLPPRERQALTVVYAWTRITDDIADDDSMPMADRQHRLDQWRDASLLNAPPDAAEPHAAILPSFHKVLVDHRIAMGHVAAVLDGVASDLVPQQITTVEDLWVYCDRVAAAVGMMCLAVWGVRDPEAIAPAAATGRALQLTNILRDLVEDAARGRIYLPRDDRDRFGITGDRWQDGPAFRALVAFQCRRAREQFALSQELDAFLPVAARGMVRVMSGIYSRLLTMIEHDPAAVLQGRLRVPKWRKSLIIARAFLGRSVFHHSGHTRSSIPSPSEQSPP
jgi:15-cis-phytoene synthase